MDLKDKGPIIIAGVLIVLAVVIYSRSTPSVSIGAQVVQPNTSSTDAANAQIAAANASNAATYDQLISQEFEQMVGFGAKIQDNLTSVHLADISSQQAIAIAKAQADAQKTMYNDQLQAIKTQSNNQAKSSILGNLFGTIGAFFGL
jgi:hypothetical protein